MGSSTIVVIDHLASTSGNMISSVFPMFFLAVGFFIALFALGFIINGVIYLMNRLLEKH